MASDNRVEIDQDVAQKLFIEGAVLVLLDMPLGSEFGIDCNSWNIGERFRGIKMIPPGVHFVYYSAVGIDKQMAPRTGFFYDFKARQVLVKKWDKQTEDIQQQSVTDDEQESMEKNKMELDRYLGVYPYDSFSKWVSLSSHLTAAVVARLQPTRAHICAATQLVSDASTTASRRAAAPPTDAAGLPVMQAAAGTDIRFSAVPHRCFPEGATAAQRTQHSLDASYALDSLVASLATDSQLLGELQFAFVCFLIGNVYDAFDQWKQLVRLLCSCDRALTTRGALYLALIPVLHHQLREVPRDFFVDVISTDNFLVATLRSLFSRVADADVSPTLHRRALMFRDNLQRRFKWDFSLQPDDEEDCQPVIVEMADTDQQSLCT